MGGYVAFVGLVCWLVTIMLLYASVSICKAVAQNGRVLLASGLGAVYSGACAIRALHFLGGPLIRIACLAAVGGVAFGFRRASLKNTGAYVLLTLAVEGVSLAVGQKDPWALFASAVMVCGLCFLCGYGQPPGGTEIPVELYYKGKSIKVCALRDTGNCLRDPVSGESVLVVGARVAEELLGIGKKQLEDPIETMASLPVTGLRLIPYRTVGNKSMMLGIRMERIVKEKRIPVIVGFAPEGLEDDRVEALIGGYA